MHDDLCKLEKDTPSSSRLSPVPGLNGQQVRLWLNCNPHSHPWLEALAQWRIRRFLSGGLKWWTLKWWNQFTYLHPHGPSCLLPGSIISHLSSGRCSVMTGNWERVYRGSQIQAWCGCQVRLFIQGLNEKVFILLLVFRLVIDLTDHPACGARHCKLIKHKWILVILWKTHLYHLLFLRPSMF